MSLGGELLGTCWMCLRVDVLNDDDLCPECAV